MLQGSGGTNGEGEEKMMEVEVPVLQRILVGWRGGEGVTVNY